MGHGTVCVYDNHLKVAQDVFILRFCTLAANSSAASFHNLKNETVEKDPPPPKKPGISELLYQGCVRQQCGSGAIV